MVQKAKLLNQKTAMGMRLNYEKPVDKLELLQV